MNEQLENNEARPNGEVTLTTPEQAKAVQDTGFLGQFLEPVSPSEVAKKLGLSANLAHHHAQRHVALGLLRLVKREHGRVYYQLTARTFKHARSLLPAGDPDEYTAATLTGLREHFLRAYERSDSLTDADDPNWSVHSFGRRTEATPTKSPVGAPLEPALELHPAHFQVRILPLTAESYRRLVRDISRLLSEATFETLGTSGPCTLAFLAMDGDLQAGTRDSDHLSSFVIPPGPN